MMYRIRQYVFLLFSLLMSHECTQVSWPSNSSTHDDLECLRDLSVDHLLKIRRALQLMSTKNGHVDSADLLNAHLLPSATINNQLAVYNGVKNNPPVAIPLKKRGWEAWPEEKTSKTQKILQVSITALSFLAFGGYLLCMIVQAIKSKGATYFYPTIQSTVRKRRPSRRDRRDTDDHDQTSPSSDDFFNVMVYTVQDYFTPDQNLE